MRKILGLALVATLLMSASAFAAAGRLTIAPNATFAAGANAPLGRVRPAIRLITASPARMLAARGPLWTGAEASAAAWPAFAPPERTMSQFTLVGCIRSGPSNS